MGDVVEVEVAVAHDDHRVGGHMLVDVDEPRVLALLGAGYLRLADARRFDDATADPGEDGKPTRLAAVSRGPRKRRQGQGADVGEPQGDAAGAVDDQAGPVRG